MTAPQQKYKRCPSCKRTYPVNEIVCAVDGTLLLAIGPDPIIGCTLNEKYFVLSEIGRGGMSIVYKAKHTLMDRVVAIKMLMPELIEDFTSTKRFQQEAQAASCLNHPNVIGVHDFGLAATGQPYIVMDYLTGESLAEIIAKHGYMEQERAINIFIQAANALEHAHKKGVIHRDLKCSHIILVTDESRTDIVKVLDFGISKLMPSSGKQLQNLTQTGEVFGSPIYMSPEQCLGMPLDARSDIYSMGVVMYETLTGYPPLMGNTIVETMRAHVTTQPPPFKEVSRERTISNELENMVFQALAKDPNDRFESMKLLSEALDHLSQRLWNTKARQTTQQRTIHANTLTSIPTIQGTTVSQARIPRARITASMSSTAISRYGTKGPDAVIQAVAPTTASASRSTVQAPKKLPRAFLISVGIIALFIAVIILFLTRQH